MSALGKNVNEEQKTATNPATESSQDLCADQYLAVNITQNLLVSVANWSAS